MSDENETESYRRWCPECQREVEEAELRVRADGKPRHTTCDAITKRRPPNTHTADCVLLVLGGACSCGASDREMRELATRMAADEAGDGNFAAAAELKSFAEGSPLEQRYPGLQGRLSAKFDAQYAVDPETGGPLRAESPGERHLDAAAELEKLVPGLTYVGSNGLTYRGDPDAETGPLTPGQVMCTVCRLDDRTRAATDPNDLQCSVCRANEPIRLEKQHRAAQAARVSTIDWSVFGPEVAATVQARQHIWDAGAGSLRDCYCARGGDHTEEPLSDLQVWANGQTADLRADIERVMATPEPPVRSRADEEQAFAADLRRLLPQVTGAKLHTDHVTALAGAFVDRGWVLAARGRVEQDTEADRG